MPDSPSTFSGVFVSYRREDTAGHAGRLFDRLSEHFGRERIFMDVDHIAPGVDFVDTIEKAVGSCEVLIAMIGRNWLRKSEPADGPNARPDFVRMEIVAALKRNIRVIPVLVQRANMPDPRDLPEELGGLSRRNAIELSDLDWHNDVDQFIAFLEETLASSRKVSNPPPAKTSRMKIAAICGCVALLAVVGLFALFMTRSSRVTNHVNVNVAPSPLPSASAQVSPPTANEFQLEDSALKNANRGDRFYAQQKWVEAEHYYREAVRLEPGNVTYNNKLGNALFGQGEGHYEEAAKYLQKAVNKAPNDPILHFNLGNTFYALRWNEKAEMQYRLARNLEPGNAEYRARLGNSLHAQGKYQQAEWEYQAALKIDPGNQQYQLFLENNRKDMKLGRNR